MLNPNQTLAIVCGAKEWPNIDNFEMATAFENSANLIREYLTKESGLKLASNHILWLFNKPQANAQYDLINEFLKERFAALGAPRGHAVLILFFYIGHGAFFGPTRDYCLLVQDTRGPLEADTSLRVSSLARLFRSQAPESSRVLVLDCCFAGEAARLFQGQLDQAVSVKAHQIVGETPTDRGVALLCASSARNPATMESATSHTFFSRQMVQVLTEGDSSTYGPLTLRQLCELVRRGLRNEAGNGASNPELHVPDQTSGDLGATPLFPNAAWPKLRSTTLAEQRPTGRKLLIVEDMIGDTVVTVLEAAGYACTLIKSLGAWRELRDQGLGEYGGALVDLHLTPSLNDALGMIIISYLRDATQIPAALMANLYSSHSRTQKVLAEYRLVDLIVKDDQDRWFQDLRATARLLVGTDEESRRHRLSTWIEATVYKVTREAMDPEGDDLAHHQLRACLRAANQARDAIRSGSLDEAQRQVDNLCLMYP